MNIQTTLTSRRYLLIVLITVIGLILAGCAMDPKFTYQGVLTDASGNPINGRVHITYRIYNADTHGTLIYQENDNVTVENGRFNSVVGPSALGGNLDPKDLAQPLWVELTIGNGTYTETLTPRQRLYGAPYAFTLMPGTVISSTMNREDLDTYGMKVDAVVNVVNTYNSADGNTPIPALRVVGEHGIELVGITSGGDGPVGTLYSEESVGNSSINVRTNNDFIIHLDQDSISDDYGAFLVWGDSVTEWCRFNDSGDLNCTGTKSSVTEVDGELRALYAVESPDVWFEDFGSGQLTQGKTIVEIEPLFAETVNLDIEYHVFLTPLGDCNGLYVTNKTATGFEVRELGGGTSSVAFDYRIVAKRGGYEDLRLEPVSLPQDGE